MATKLTAADLRVGDYYGYKVREDGVIFSKKTGLPMKQALNDKGYLGVTLSINKKAVFKRVHRIVAEVFIPNPENKPCVNHKDMNRANPHCSNLEWVTHSENVIHSIKNGSRANWTRNNSKEKNPNAKLNNEIVCAIRDLYYVCGYSQNKIGSIFNLNQSRITKIVNYKQW